MLENLVITFTEMILNENVGAKNSSFVFGRIRSVSSQLLKFILYKAIFLVLVWGPLQSLVENPRVCRWPVFLPFWLGIEG